MKMLRTVTVVAALLLTGARVHAQPGPESFLNGLREAEEKSQAREWKAAIPLWERVIATNPHVGWFWYSLGTAQFNSGEYRKAASSFERALELGVGRLSIIAFDV